MSNIYITEPPPSGKVILVTSRGEIEVELFADQCPLACKNFIALALEGYYDNITWHRYVADFIIQTGDPTGTGIGGDSFYGHEFEDEPHQRLRFNRRGLLGMANGQDRNTNASQFFLTLAATPELQSRHTMFGRISGKTIYNLVALADSLGELRPDDDRPLYPPKLKTVRVIENPFEGQLKLRITREEKLTISKNKREAEQRKGDRGAAEGRSSRKKNTALLSFGEAEEEGESSISAPNGPKSSHDLLKNDKRLRAEVYVPPVDTQKSKEETSGDERPVVARIPIDEPAQNLSTGSAPKGQASSSDKIAELESSIRGTGGKGSHIDAKQANGAKGKDERKRGKTLLDEYRAKYIARKGTRSKKRDEETAQVLQSFQTSLRRKKEVDVPSKPLVAPAEESVSSDLREYGADENDEDDNEADGWRNHRFDSGGKALNEDRHNGEEYVMLDPRNAASSAALHLGFGGQEGYARSREERAKQGRRGRDWVDERSGHSRREEKRVRRPAEEDVRPGYHHRQR